MDPARSACDNGSMPPEPPPAADRSGETHPGRRGTAKTPGDVTGTAPAPTNGPTAGPGRRFVRRLGVGVAVLLVPLGVGVAWIGAFVGNCKWGFFGDTGPIAGAAEATWQDLAVAGAGWSIAALSWLVIAWRTRRPGLRIAAWWAVGIASAGVLVLSVLPQVLLGDAHWAATCT